MARDGVGAECVENDQAVVAVRSDTERAPRVSQDHPDRGRAGLQVCEVARVPGDPQDDRVDLVERELLTRPAVARQRAGPEADDAHGPRAPGSLHRPEHLADGAGSMEVGERLLLPSRLETLSAM